MRSRSLQEIGDWNQGVQVGPHLVTGNLGRHEKSGRWKERERSVSGMLGRVEIKVLGRELSKQLGSLHIRLASTATWQRRFLLCLCDGSTYDLFEFVERVDGFDWHFEEGVVWYEGKV